MTEMSGATESSDSFHTTKINYGRVVSCGLLSGVICILLKALVEEPFFSRPFFDALRGAGSPVRHELPPSFLVIAVTATLLVCVYAMWLYASIRPRYGPGARTAIIAGFAVWFLIAITDSVWASFQLLPPRALLAPVLCALPEIVIALLVGARFYCE